MSEIRAIFSINPGRSGSQYLAKILAAGRNCIAFHEQNPSGFGQTLADYHQGDERGMQDVARAKHDFIARLSKKNLIYAETNHCFIKGFGWPLMKKMDPRSVAIIVLRRDPDKIVNSMIKVRSLPLSSTGRYYNLTPDRMNPVVPPPTLFGLTPAASYRIGKLVALPEKVLAKLKIFLFGYPIRRYVPLRRYQEKIIRWYLDETRELEKLFKIQFPDCVYIHMDIDELNDLERVMALFHCLGVECNKEDLTELGVPANTRDSQKKQFFE